MDNNNPKNPIGDMAEQNLVHNQNGLIARIRQYFITGIIVTAPIVITVWTTWWVLTFIDKGVARLIPEEYNPNHALPFYIPGIGLIVAVTFFILVGWFARNFLGRMIIRVSEYIVSRMPIIRMFYNAIKQVFEMTIGAKSNAFRDVVLFQFPHPNSWTIGFVTGVTPGEIQTVGGGSEVLNIYIPVTPTTAGFVVFVPKKDVIYLSMSVEDAVKLIASGGIIVPQLKGVKQDQ